MQGCCSYYLILSNTGVKVFFSPKIERGLSIYSCHFDWLFYLPWFLDLFTFGHQHWFPGNNFTRCSNCKYEVKLLWARDLFNSHWYVKRWQILSYSFFTESSCWCRCIRWCQESRSTMEIETTRGQNSCWLPEACSSLRGQHWWANDSFLGRMCS